MGKFDCATDGNMEDFRQANRRVANVPACEASAAAETAERDRQKSAIIAKRGVATALDSVANKVMKISPEQARKTEAVALVSNSVGQMSNLKDPSENTSSMKQSISCQTS
jgi:hypothetical protein